MIQKSIGKNLFYNILLQMITLALPLITLPYISRVLKAEGIGIYSFTNSIMQYFVIIGTLGLNLYGNRQIAYSNYDKKTISNTFWSLMVLRSITSGIACVLYIILCLILPSNYKIIMILQLFQLVSSALDISWLFMGLEDFKKTVVRNILIRLIGTILTVVLIQKANQLWLYTIIIGVTSLLGNLSMWFFLPKTVFYYRECSINTKEHILPVLKIFIPQIAMQIYVVLDKTMLGVLATSVAQVGYYEQCEKIVKAVLSIVTSLGIVMLPRMSNLFSIGDQEKLKYYLNFNLRCITLISLPMIVGMISVSNSLIPWFLGNEFLSAIHIFKLLTPIVYIIAVSNICGIQYLLPTAQNKKFSISVISGAIINFTFNILLIPKYNAAGACIATLFAEIIVTSIQLKFVSKVILWMDLIKNTLKYFILSMIMFLFIKDIGKTFENNYGLILAVKSTIGVLIYFILLIVTKDDLLLLAFNKLKMYLLKCPRR